MIETNADYHADTQRLSNSMLTVLKRCPQEFHARYITKKMAHPEPSPSMALGEAVHCMVLEPEQYPDRFAIKPEGIDRRTTVGKQAWISFCEKAGSKSIIDVEDHRISESCANALLKHDQLSMVLERPGIVEQRIDFVCEGIEMRCKPDLVLPDIKLIVDVKTTKDASPRSFGHSLADYGYARQAALYRDAVAIQHGIECRFLFAVVCTASPFEVACYELTGEAMRQGLAEAEALVREFKQRCELNDWLPVWSKGIVPIDLPRYYKHESYEAE
jgi:exodeoxyribonuclease VIII